MRSQDLLVLLLLVAVPVVEWPRSPPAIGAPQPRLACPAWVETPAGVACVDGDTAQRLGIRSGDRLRDGGDGGRGRMAPARLAALAAPVDLNHASLDELASLDGV